jgi:ABC-type dipeptide/oligopeptide/nickel transport system ATPase component
MRQVGIPAPEKRMSAFPHQLSGGMSQRVMIAMAIACHPKLLIADEPTTALDVTIQAQILDLLLKLQQDTGMALVLITHDMGVVAETAQRVAVQYAGQKVEEQPVRDLFDDPHHPYTAALLAALPERAHARGCRRSRASCRASSTGRRAACSRRAAALPPSCAPRPCRRVSRPASARRCAITRSGRESR